MKTTASEVSRTPIRRRRILLSAYAVSPIRGSEPSVGWNISTRLAKFHDVTVLCSPNVPPGTEDFRGEIRTFLSEHGAIDGLDFHFVEPPLLSYLLQRESLLLRRSLYYTGYRAWQRAAFVQARNLNAERSFDLVHHLNIIGYREPGYLWRLPIPFVWGPIAGAADIPASFFSIMSPRERSLARLRNTLNSWTKKSSKRCRLAAARAAKVWVVGAAEREMVSAWGKASTPMIETGTAHTGSRPKTRDRSRPLRIAWSGQHVGLKALPLLLEAIGGLTSSVWLELIVLGDGPEKQRWVAQAQRLGLAGRARWLGWVPREVALKEVAAADIFAFTSVKEATSNAILEALSLGLPVVCHDACGMGIAVTSDSGIKVALRDPPTSVAGFAEAIRNLSSDDLLFARLSAGALARAAELSWDRKALEIASTYEDIISNREDVAGNMSL
jgi:glycosyltransferase involved in cell wall biosynthesis